MLHTYTKFIAIGICVLLVVVAALLAYVRAAG